METNKQYHSVEDLSIILNCTPQYTRKLIRDGKIPAEQVGKTWVINSEVLNDNEGLKWRTKGYANNTEDRSLVPSENLLGIYKGVRIPNAGSVAMFMQTTPGLIVCVICPLLLLVGYDLVRRKFADKNRKDDTDALMKELQELKALAAANLGAAPTNSAEQPTQTEEEILETTEV